MSFTGDERANRTRKFALFVCDFRLTSAMRNPTILTDLTPLPASLRTVPYSNIYYCIRIMHIFPLQLN